MTKTVESLLPGRVAAVGKRAVCGAAELLRQLVQAVAQTDIPAAVQLVKSRLCERSVRKRVLSDLLLAALALFGGGFAFTNSAAVTAAEADLYMVTVLPFLGMLLAVFALCEAVGAPRSILAAAAALWGAGHVLQILLDATTAAEVLTYHGVGIVLALAAVWAADVCRRLPPRSVLVLANGASAAVYLLLFLLGSGAGSTKAWLSIAGFSVQLTEPAKLLALAAFAAIAADTETAPARRTLQWLVTIGLHLGSLFLLNELGTACVLLVVWLLAGYLSGQGRPFAAAVAAVAAAGSAAWGFCCLCAAAAQPTGVVYLGRKIYEKIQLRAMMFLDIESLDPYGPAQQVLQTQKALLMSGWLGSTDNPTLFLPVGDSDLISISLALRGGAISLFALIMLGSFLLVQLLVYNKNKNRFLCIMAAAGGCSIYAQTMLSCCSASGSIPLIGIGAPLLARGGTGEAVSLAMLAIGLWACSSHEPPRGLRRRNV